MLGFCEHIEAEHRVRNLLQMVLGITYRVVGAGTEVVRLRISPSLFAVGDCCNDVRYRSGVDTSAQGVHHNDTAEGVTDEDDRGVGAAGGVFIGGSDHERSGDLSLSCRTVVGHEVLVGPREGGGDVSDQSAKKAKLVVGAGNRASSSDHLWMKV